MQINRSDTAVVFIDPQNEVLSETGLAWPLVRESLEENNTIGNMERIFKVAKTHGFEIFVSPHYFLPATRGGSSTDRSNPTRRPPIFSPGTQS